MSFRWLRGALVVLAAAGLCGCPRPAENQTDEQNNSHYRAGKDKLSALDYKGALASFERALEANPRSALAHFELALLYEQRENDYAAALYHYQRALKLRPNAYPADNARQRIPGCKQELVKADSLALINPTALRETERLREENAALRRQIDSLQAQLAARAGAHAPLTPAARPTAPSHQRPPDAVLPRVASPSTAANTTRTAPPATRPRTHLVKTGETPMAIARLYQVRLDALLAANPGLDARRMRVGQAVNIPAP